MVKKLSNFTLAQIRTLLAKNDCKPIRITGGHEVWSRKDLKRPIIIQTHIDPVPEFIVKQILRTLKIDRKDL